MGSIYCEKCDKFYNLSFIRINGWMVHELHTGGQLKGVCPACRGKSNDKEPTDPRIVERIETIESYINLNSSIKDFVSERINRLGDRVAELEAGKEKEQNPTTSLIIKHLEDHRGEWLRWYRDILEPCGLPNDGGMSVVYAVKKLREQGKTIDNKIIDGQQYWMLH